MDVQLQSGISGELELPKVALSGSVRAPTVSVLNRCLPDCVHCQTLGCLAPHELNGDELGIQLTHIAKNGFARVSFPPNILLSTHANTASLLARQNGLVPVLRITSAYPLRAHWQTIVIWLRDGAEIEMIIDRMIDKEDSELIEKIEKQIPGRVTPLIAPVKNSPLDMLALSVPVSIQFKTELLIPSPSSRPDAMTCDEIHSQIESLKAQNFPIPLRACWTFDQSDGSLPEWFEIDPDLVPALESKSFKPAPKLSIVIATTNRKEQLINCIRHLQKQTSPADDFELIIVDDGSSDGTFLRIREHFTRNSSRFNLKYFILDRPYNRTPGDDLYRVGRARNFAVSKSVGKSLLFLNPEVIASTDFVIDALKQLDIHFAIQYPYYLVPFKKSSQRPRYTDLNAKSFRKIFDSKWQVDCGVAFGVRREGFIQAGGFARAFHTYGFEDTLLAWQLKKRGHAIAEGKKEIFLLEPPREVSEFKNSGKLKQKVSKRSARLFYALTLDEGFYRDFFPVLNGLTKPRTVVGFAAKTWLGRLFLQPLYYGLLFWREPRRSRKRKTEELT